MTPSSVIRRDSLTLTKRNVLKQLASVNDPLGFFAPVVLNGKLLLQATWCEKLSSDDKIDEECTSQWSLLKPDLLSVSDFHIPRNNKIERCGVIQFLLVCFCDASKSAHAAVVYLLQKNEVTSRSDHMVANTRLAPIKQITISRLELMVVQIGVRCVQFVKVQRGLSLANIYLWSDSQCVHNWLCTAKSLSVFMQNRVSEIKGHKDISFGYTPSKENPADIASRGSTVQNLVENDCGGMGLSEDKRPTQTTSSVVRSEFESELKKM